MQISIQSLFFAAYTLLAVFLAWYGVVLGYSNRAQLRRMHVLCQVFAGIFVLPFFLTTALGSLPGTGPLLWASPMLPVLCLMFAYSNLRSLRGQSIGVAMLCIPMVTWNLLLAAIYSLRSAQTLLLFDMGHIPSSALTAFALMQRNIGMVDAELLPIFLIMPFALPPFLYPGRHPLLIAGLGGFLASLMLSLFATTLPHALTLNVELRKLPPETNVAERPDLQLSMGMSVDGIVPPELLPAFIDNLGNSADLQTRVKRARKIGLAAVELPVRADLVNDESKFKLISDLAKEIKAQGMRLVISVQSPSSVAYGRRLSFGEYTKRMQEAQWILGERLQPDLLVLFAEPFAKLREATLDTLKVADWIKTVEESLAILNEGQPDLLTAVDLYPREMECEELYKQLSRASCKLSQLRMIIRGNRVASGQVRRSLHTLGGLLAVTRPKKPVWLVAQPPSPLGFGGPLAQTAYIRHMLAFASRQDRISGINLGSMIDSSESLNGYWDSRDWSRHSLTSLVAMLQLLRKDSKTVPDPGK